MILDIANQSMDERYSLDAKWQDEPGNKISLMATAAALFNLWLGLSSVQNGCHETAVAGTRPRQRDEGMKMITFPPVK